MAGTARKRGAGGTVLKAAAGLNLVTNYLLTIILLREVIQVPDI